MADGACPTCGSFVEEGVCENMDTHPSTRTQHRELSFKQMMYQIVREAEQEKKATSLEGEPT